LHSDFIFASTIVFCYEISCSPIEHTALLTLPVLNTSQRWGIPKEDPMTVKKELLDILACPKCKGDIHLNEKEDGLICDSCQLLYEIRDDIPIMLIDEARPL